MWTAGDEAVEAAVRVPPSSKAPVTPEPNPLPPVLLQPTPVEDEAVWRRKKRKEGGADGDGDEPYTRMRMLSSSSLPTGLGQPSPPSSGQPPLPFDLGRVPQQGAPAHPPHKYQRPEAPLPKGNGVKKVSNAQRQRVLSNREIIKMRVELRKQQQQQLPEGFVPAMAMCSVPNSNSSCADQNTHHSSPFGAFFDQFCYKPVRQDRNRALSTTPGCLARPPPRGHTSSEHTASETSRAVKGNTSSTHTLKRKQPSSASGSQGKALVKGKEKPVNKTMKKNQRKPTPSLTRAEKFSDKYRRLPLDQLVPPPRSPHKLLQEKYASDPWKVIVICMLLNLTQGKQVRRKVKGFFKRYPDPQTAFNADCKKMAIYLTPLGLYHVKAKRIQKFSKAYVEDDWTHITELCGVGKYAADAYAIFCAGRATELVPKDHKLVDYWKYVCFELPAIQGMQVQEAAVTELQNVVPKVQELPVPC